MCMKASAYAHPVQELIKLHGPKDNPYVMQLRDAVSVCTAPFKTQTTIEFGDFDKDTATADGIEFMGTDLAWLTDIVDGFRLEAESSSRFRMLSVSNFPRGEGFATKTAVLASLALASCSALNLKLDHEEISRRLVRHSPLAAMSITGGFSRLRLGAGEDSRSVQISSGNPELGMFLVLVPRDEPGFGFGGGLRAPPGVGAGIAEIPTLADEMELAIRENDAGKVCIIAERDTLLLHGVTLIGTGEVHAWGPRTLGVIHAVRTMRDGGLPAFFSTVRDGAFYINTIPDRLNDVNERVKGLELEYWKLGVGGEASITNDHLF
jgi:phosphomevalonate decarboxylase